MESEKARLETIWENRQKRFVIGLCLLLAVCIIAVYAQTAGSDFVDYDDQVYVKNNPHVLQGLTWDSIKWSFTTMYGSNWFPLIWLSLILDSTIFGTWAGGFHLVNVAFHIANTILLFWVLKRYSKSLWPSFFVAALFALHPLHVESVAWVTERKDVLSTLFWLLTMLAYLRYVEIPTTKRYVIVCAVFTLGLMSKPMLVTLPLVLLLMDYWPLRRLLPEDGRTGVSICRSILEKTPLFILSAASCVVTFIAQRTGGAVMRLSTLPLAVRIENAVVSYCQYIIKMFLPTGLAFFYPHYKTIELWKVATAAMVLLAVTLAVILLRRRRYLLVGWFWYLGTLVPVIGVVQVGGQAMADRYTYIPLTGIFIMLVWLTADVLSQRKFGRVVATIAGSAILGVLGVMTFVQVSYWHDTLSLFKHATTVIKDNYIAYGGIGVYYAEKGQMEEAMEAFDMALKTTPSKITSAGVDNLYNIAKSLDLLGKTDEALKFYNRVLEIVPDDADTHGALAIIEAKNGNFDRAVELYRKGLDKKPDDGGLHGGLGSLYLQMGQVDDAIIELEKAVKLKADSQIYGNLAMAVMSKGEIDKAMQYFDKAIKLDSANAEVHYNLANFYLSQGLYDKAVAEYEKAIKSKPDYTKAYGNLAVTLAQMNQLDGAVVNFRKVVELEPNNPDAKFNFAMILVDMGEVDEAEEQLIKTIELAPRDSAAHSALAKLMLQKGEFEQSVIEYRYALDIDPNNKDAQAGLKQALISRDKESQSKKNQ